ncbi:MAG TPA: hypothetical protein VLY04_15330 [Bryobacteraceae bacterium]|nr:hypothetical protein [Bryobacteraceae bacterium]
MTRTLYRWLLWLHPPVFRRQFAGEMLWIFDEVSETEGGRLLLFDGLASLARQWLLRSGSWKVAAALILALMQVSAGGLALDLIRRHSFAHIAVSTPVARMPINLATLIVIAISLVGCIAVAVIGLAQWVHHFSTRRIRVSRRGRLCSNSAR